MNLNVKLYQDNLACLRKVVWLSGTIKHICRHWMVSHFFVWADIWESLRLEILQGNLWKTDPKMTKRLKRPNCTFVASPRNTFKMCSLVKHLVIWHKVCLECRFIHFTYFHKVISMDRLSYAFLSLPRIKETCVRWKDDRSVNWEERWSSTWAQYSVVGLDIFFASTAGSLDSDCANIAGFWWKAEWLICT